MLIDGTFRHPFLTPVDEENPHPFPGRREEYDLNSYIQGMKVEAVYEGAAFTPDPFHTWQNIVDFEGRRYLFHYDRSDGRVYDITDVNAVSVVESLTRSDVEVEWGVNPEKFASRDWKAHDFWGASSIQWNERLSSYVMIQSFEQKRQIGELGTHPPEDKLSNPEGVAALRATPQLKGFKVYELEGPRKKDWKLLAAVSTDATKADPLASDVNSPQQGSGSLDVPYYVGDKYLFIAVAHRFLPAPRKLRTEADGLLHVTRRPASWNPDLCLLQRRRPDLRRERSEGALDRRLLRSQGVREGDPGLRLREPDARGLRGVGPQYHLDVHQPRHLRPLGGEAPREAEPRSSEGAVPHQRALGPR
jgi:hypothetical protein